MPDVNDDAGGHHAMHCTSCQLSRKLAPYASYLEPSSRRLSDKFLYRNA